MNNGPIKNTPINLNYMIHFFLIINKYHRQLSHIRKTSHTTIYASLLYIVLHVVVMSIFKFFDLFFLISKRRIVFWVEKFASSNCTLEVGREIFHCFSTHFKLKIIIYPTLTYGVSQRLKMFSVLRKSRTNNGRPIIAKSHLIDQPTCSLAPQCINKQLTIIHNTNAVKLSINQL